MYRRGTIYIAYHKEAPIYAGKPLIPIHVGRAVSDLRLPELIGDDTGDNISARNPCYCELTAHYWAWKNDRESSFIGLMHYRRFLEAVPALAAQPERFAPYLNADAFAADWERTFETLGLNGTDMILPVPRRLKETVYDQYAKSHAISDLDRLRDIIAACRPDFLDDFDRTLAARELLPGNMFVMSRPMFEHYSELLFDLTQAHYENPPADFKDRTAYDARYIGFLGERLLTAYVPYALRKFPHLRVQHRTMLLVDREKLRSAGPLRQMRFVAKGRLSVRDLIRLSSEKA